MNSSEQVKKFLTALAASFPGEVKQERLNIYVSVLSTEIESANLGALFNELVKRHQFFPSVKEILDVANPHKETPREKAELFVDLMIGALHASGSINDLVGEANYSFWKKNTGIDRFAISQGSSVDLRFQRGALIDKFERIFKGENVLQLGDRKADLTLVGKIDPQEGA